MSKNKLFVVATAVAATVVAPYATQAETDFQAAGQGLYVVTAEQNLFYKLSEVTPELVVNLIRTHGAENVHFVVGNQYSSAKTIMDKPLSEAYQAQTPENTVPAGEYVNTTGETVPVGETPEEKVNETFFYNLAA